MSEYFLKPNILGRNVKVELNLSNFATKLYLKNTTGVDTPKYVKKVDLASLKSEIDKLETTSFDLSKVSNVVKIDVVNLFHLGWGNFALPPELCKIYRKRY